jgi:hypothetical protein
MANPIKRFKTKLGTEDQGSLFIELPFDPRETFGAARAKVKVRVNRHAYRSTVSVYGGRFYVPVSKANRDAARVHVGDMVNVVLELDTEPRVVVVPAPLASAFENNRRAKAAWDGLSYSHQREHADAISSAKRPETVTSRVKKTIELLLAKA